MEHSLTQVACWWEKRKYVLILILMEKMNTQSQRAEGYLNLLANVGNISGKRKICAKIVHGCCYFQNFH